MKTGDILKKALEIEEDGYKFYSESAEKSQMPDGQKFLRKLANDELLHIKIIKKQYDKIEKNLEGEVIDKKDLDELKDRLDKFEEFKLFPDSEVENFDKGIDLSNEIMIVEKALDFERKGYNFYKENIDLVEDVSSKQFLTFLAEMEEIHIKLLNYEYDFLVNSGFWYDNQEIDIEGSTI